jgi:Sel1 repeat
MKRISRKRKVKSNSEPRTLPSGSFLNIPPPSSSPKPSKRTRRTESINNQPLPSATAGTEKKPVNYHALTLDELQQLADTEADNSTHWYKLSDRYDEVGDSKKSFDCAVRSADLGDRRGMAVLGWCYSHGSGIEKNDEQSFKYSKMAADRDERCALFNLALDYQCGKGVGKDDDKAHYYFIAAARRGDTDALQRLKAIESFARGDVTARYLAGLFKRDDTRELTLAFTEFDKEKPINFGFDHDALLYWAQLTSLTNYAVKAWFDLLMKNGLRPSLNATITDHEFGTEHLIHVALDRGTPASVSCMIREPTVDLNVRRDKTGSTVLMHAMQKGWTDIVHELLREVPLRVEWDAVDNNGKTFADLYHNPTTCTDQMINATVEYMKHYKSMVRCRVRSYLTYPGVIVVKELVELINSFI